MRTRGGVLNSKNLDKNDLKNEDIRLQVYLARAGICSRRSSEDFLKAGRIRVDNKVIKEPGFRVSAASVVELDGHRISINHKIVYYLLHKPTKTLCSEKDETGKHRTLVGELIKPFIQERIFAIGRLDYLTSGLLLFTNDGDGARKLSHPSTEMEKEYVVETKKEIPVDLLEAFVKGLRIEGELYHCKAYKLLSSHSARIVLTEGKNQEIRKVFLSRNITVSRVHRLRFGPLSLTGLEPGRFKKLSKYEIDKLLKG
jgi:23S rRNA pseudouridine2605 synthase